MKIGLIDYGAGNLGSVRNALAYIGHQVEVQKDAQNLKLYDKLILPGVGAFGDVMGIIHARGFDEAIVEFARSGKPLLGICLGMQLLFEKSYEFGEHKGLGLLSGEIVRFANAPRIPHIGWNQCFLSERGKTHALLKGIKDGEHLYFVHSFHADLAAGNDEVLAMCEYGERFPAIVGRENIFGIQPHPEKSHAAGLKILKNFIEM
ncbi:imidazole glycerol phosphate synthase, glutamine amidotransferase subunit [Helicobacter sp. CLO-3]|uniref:imidazole glycerol phosphate synthase subunit HisH n=1 Tax=unclassified Helicobacter TaxID=2593540 RepID=UPI000804A7F6|nr:MULTISPECIES: imidazole glycerol phosphate synthase subunit HisH [unclassified Helicobacter]OBV28934.1 imidazole glycerol phosphate synthase, glutamine amidotransferase subunit [Helicobacter sp. CLO-3]OHU81550.1 imidazole glycerol phosphate synthase, glutamine amidotransferase subunit [Helicobacter sp. CLO-3]